MGKYRDIQFTLNLEKVFGHFPESDRTLKEAIGQRAMDMIIERTQQGLDKDGKRFVPYSDSYKDSLEFKAAGKNPNTVDLTLFGDMLDTLEIVKQSPKTVTLGWRDELQNAKAHGHVTGNIRNDGKPRDFMGLTKDQVSQLYEEFREDVDAAWMAERGGVDISTDEERAALELLDLILSRQS